MININNIVYDNWIMTARDSGRKNNNRQILSEYTCSVCGNKKYKTAGYMKNHIPRCETCYENHYKYDYINKSYSDLTIIEYLYTNSSGHFYICKCVCGNIAGEISLANLKSGHTASCGCKRSRVTIERHLTHGLSYTRIYSIYSSILQRCYNINDKRYADYGGRGILVSNDWLGDNGVVNFYNDMNKSYEEHVLLYGEKDTTIERMDVNGNYCKENCRWATMREQGWNKRNSNIINFYGKNYSVMEFIELYGLERKYATRMYRGTSPYQIIKDTNSKLKVIRFI